MILEALVDPAGRSPAKNTLDHLLQVAVRVGYIDKRRHKRDGTLAWVAGTALPSEEDMAKHLNGFSGHRRKLSAVSVREADQ
jgi:hypothetical protein